jgi:hypothetical protein
MKTKEKTNTYTGIADCHGIESYHRIEDSNQGILCMRANANDQRHAVVYEADMTENDYDSMMLMLEGGEEQAALLYLKGSAKEIRVAGGKHAEKLFGNIPNPELDPWA